MNSIFSIGDLVTVNIEGKFFNGNIIQIHEPENEKSLGYLTVVYFGKDCFGNKFAIVDDFCGSFVFKVTSMY